MLRQKGHKSRLKKAALGLFFVVLGLFSAGVAPLVETTTVYAVPNDGEGAGQQTDENGEPVENGQENGGENQQNETNQQNGGNGQNGSNGQSGQEQQNATEAATANKSCEDSLGAIGWLVCPTTGKLAEAVDWLYERLEGILVLNPVRMEDGLPIYEIWKYALGLTNVVFVIFFLVVIYSQLTGVGISNYGIKKSLPKLIVMAILVNLSFLICSVAVDVSNIFGMGIRNLFEAVEESVAQTSNMSMQLGMGGILEALGGAGLLIGATVIAFETGAIWMLIPVVLGAIVAVVVGLITIAMRQAVVALLVMISPLAMVMAILPNTEQWFNKWRQLFIQMLIFYPMFSLLFGASALAGFAIITSATDGFGLILGIAVQTFPLFFAWKLMQMSGTFLETVNSKLRAISARPLGGVNSWADRRRQLSQQKHLAGRAYMPSLRLMQFMSNRRVAQDAELSQHQEMLKNRGLAHRARQNYLRDGRPSRKGEQTYREMTQSLDYQREALRDQNNLNRGLGSLAQQKTPMQRRQATRLAALDNAMVNASDYLKAEQTRGELIDFENAMGYNERMGRMMNAHIDNENGFLKTRDENGNEVLTPKPGYLFHSDPATLKQSEDLARYNAINQIMDGSALGTQLVTATAAQSFEVQRKVRETKMQRVSDQNAPTEEVDLKLKELTEAPDAVKNVDSIVAGLRVLNQRGDTDLVLKHIQNILDHGVDLGTHASQALGNFLMFEVNGADPFMRRFGTYINLETAMAYTAGRRRNLRVTMDEMVRGQYTQLNPETGEVEIMTPKKSLAMLMEGTELDGMGRKAMDDLEIMLKHTYTGRDGNLDVPLYFAGRKAVEKSMSTQFIAASLKFLSGSDQLKALVAFKTGINDKGEMRWGPGGDLEAYAEEAEAYFRDRTIDYILAQTPNNLLGLRSDYYPALVHHLSRAYELDNQEDWSDEEREEYEALMAERADIQTRYGEDSPEEQARKRAEDMAALRDKMAGAKFRQLLDASGKLEQIYRTRRAGAANNAKDWLRQWLNLDNQTIMNERLRQIDRRQQREHEQQQDYERAQRQRQQQQSDLPPMEADGFDDADREMLADQVELVYDNWRQGLDRDPEIFFQQSYEFVEGQLHDVGGLILWNYEQFHRVNPRATAEELRDELQRLLSDENNY